MKIKAYKKIHKLFTPYIKRITANIIDRINYFLIIKKYLSTIKEKNNCVKLYNIDEKTKQIKYKIGRNIILDKRIGTDSLFGIVFLSHFKSKFDTIAEPYKCNGAQDHYTKKPIWNGVIPNFNDHPELADQHSKKAEAVSQLIATFGTLVQLLETLAAWIATAMGAIPLVIAIRTIGTLIGILIQALSIAFSPNTYDIQEYSREDFEGGGIDPRSPFAFMNEIPGLSKYIT
jgi:hypothetical protein